MDIVERLRKVPSIGGYFKDELSQEAADEIERLREKLQKMDANDFMKDVISKTNWNQVCKENEDLRQQNTELVKGLKNILLDCEEDFPSSHGAIKHYVKYILTKVTKGE
jgi:hypothetical protein